MYVGVFVCGGASQEPLWNDSLGAGVRFLYWYTVYVMHRAWRMSQEKFPVETAGQLLLAQSGGGSPSTASQKLLLTDSWAFSVQAAQWREQEGKMEGFAAAVKGVPHLQASASPQTPQHHGGCTLCSHQLGLTGRFLVCATSL